MIRDPRAVFEQLFGAGGTAEQRAERLRTDRSILDWVMTEMNGMRRSLGANDQHRLDQYTQNIRELEVRIQRIEAQNQSGDEREIPEAPVGVPDSFDGTHAPHVRPAGARVHVRHDPRLLPEDGSGRVAAGLPREWF